MYDYDYPRWRYPLRGWDEDYDYRLRYRGLDYPGPEERRELNERWNNAIRSLERDLRSLPGNATESAGPVLRSMQHSLRLMNRFAQGRL